MSNDTDIGRADDIENIARIVADYTVSFLKLEQRNGTEHVVPAGSGTLIKFGQIYGVLTAGHVLKGLPDSGDVAISLYPRNTAKLQKQTITMNHATKLIVGDGGANSNDLDIGFLRLTSPNIGNLNATNSFLNFSMGREKYIRADPPAKPYFHAVLGAVGEWLTELNPNQPNTILLGNELLFGDGEIVREYEEKNLDFYDFNISFGDGVQPPSSYGGVSGGGLWQISLWKDEARDKSPISDLTLLGLAYYQNVSSDGRLFIKCHGQKCVYEILYEKMLRRWPDEVSA